MSNHAPVSSCCSRMASSLPRPTWWATSSTPRCRSLPTDSLSSKSPHCGALQTPRPPVQSHAGPPGSCSMPDDDDDDDANDDAFLSPPSAVVCVCLWDQHACYSVWVCEDAMLVCACPLMTSVQRSTRALSSQTWQSALFSRPAVRAASASFALFRSKF